MENIKMDSNQLKELEKSKMKDAPQVGSLWRHYRGNHYVIKKIAIHETNLDLYVVYQIYNGLNLNWIKQSRSKPIIWIKRLEEWNEIILVSTEENTNFRKVVQTFEKVSYIKHNAKFLVIYYLVLLLLLFSVYWNYKTLEIEFGLLMKQFFILSKYLWGDKLYSVYYLILFTISYLMILPLSTFY
jgi:hypothetical protein